jgi:hypothetical protein
MMVQDQQDALPQYLIKLIEVDQEQQDALPQQIP